VIEPPAVHQWNTIHTVRLHYSSTQTQPQLNTLIQMSIYLLLKGKHAGSKAMFSLWFQV